MLDSPPPRRFRFGLRSMFVLVVIVAIPSAWVGYSLNWIRQRRTFRSDHPRVYFFSDSFGELPKATAPGGLGLFGEPGITVIEAKELDAGEKDQLMRLFPESKVRDASDIIKRSRESVRAQQ